ncbi:unnamed protein product [Mycetohabitans rhizoxinica HKI 454]|uniref:Uncharacterized protein n=1 Tax=Mycetohabitans rhizoxinica (strain DSM 19002 / CIP 109453 / HKI 454) TaxID=882378 RepID=E5AME6_MYCRK|nr:unnamed protein product [Mycetohabitans rhizoxinica HKI 454]
MADEDELVHVNVNGSQEAVSRRRTPIQWRTSVHRTDIL